MKGLCVYCMSGLTGQIFIHVEQIYVLNIIPLISIFDKVVLSIHFMKWNRDIDASIYL